MNSLPKIPGQVLLSAALLVIAAGSMPAAVITATAGCVDVVSVPVLTAPGSASCSGPNEQASASSGNSSVMAQAALIGPPTRLNLSSTARATFDATYLLTIHGGTGVGQFAPCLAASALENGAVDSGAFAIAGFGPATITAGSGINPSYDCNTSTGYPLAFDVPTVMQLHLSANASAGSLPHSSGFAQASFGGVRAFDPAASTRGVQVTLTELPEPATLSFAALALAAGWWMRRRVR